MYRDSHLRIAAATAAIAALLFAQVAVAAFACAAPLHTAATITMAHAMDRGDGDMDLCAEHAATASGLCVAHCNPADLSLNPAQVDAPPVMLVALHPLTDSLEQATVLAAAPALDAPLRSRSPPLSILHCCFRI